MNRFGKLTSAILAVIASTSILPLSANAHNAAHGGNSAASVHNVPRMVPAYCEAGGSSSTIISASFLRHTHRNRALAVTVIGDAEAGFDFVTRNGSPYPRGYFNCSFGPSNFETPPLTADNIRVTVTYADGTVITDPAMTIKFGKGAVSNNDAMIYINLRGVNSSGQGLTKAAVRSMQFRITSNGSMNNETYLGYSFNYYQYLTVEDNPAQFAASQTNSDSCTER